MCLKYLQKIARYSIINLQLLDEGVLMKKFSTICLAFIVMLMVVLTGCSTFTIDKVSYYNEIVAKVGNQNITRFELVNAYNNYGYSTYVTQQGQTEKEALNSTLELLAKRKIISQYATENLSKYQLTKNEINDMFRETLDNLQESIAENISQARKIYGVDEPKDTVTDEETDSDSIKKLSEYDYSKRVELVRVEGDKFKLQYVNLNKETPISDSEYALDQRYINNFADYTTNQIVDALLEKFKQELYTNQSAEDGEVYRKICDKALDLTCSNLIRYEQYLREDGKKLSTDRENLLFRMVKRSYESQLESAYIERVSTVYMENEELSTESIVNAYRALYASDKAKYEYDKEAYYDAVISTDTELICYHPTSDARFGYFLHVLLPFNNVDDELEDLADNRANYDNDEDYQREQQNLINQITCKQRTIADIYDGDELVHEEGVQLDGEVAIQDVLAEYSANVHDLQSFKKFMFKYSTDTSTLTADRPYVIGYDPYTYTGEKDSDTLTGSYSSMVANFTREAIRLMQEGQQYTLSDQYILSTYGIHLLYYVGEVYGLDNPNVSIQTLNSTILNEATGETYLDRLFDLVYPADSDGMFTSNTKYSSFETSLVDTLYGEKVVLYQTKIDASLKI